MQSTSKKQKLDNMDTQNNNNENNNSSNNQENNEEQVALAQNNPPIVMQEIKPFASSFEEFFEYPEQFLLRAEQLNSPIEVSYFNYYCNNIIKYVIDILDMLHV